MQNFQKFVLRKENSFDNPLVKNILLKNKLLREGDAKHKKIKTALIINGGGLRVIYSIGVLIAFEELGLQNVFDVVIGISSGAPVSANFLSGQSKRGSTIFYKHLIYKKFIKLLRIHKIMDLDYLNMVLRKFKSLDQDIAKIKKSRSEFYVAVTRADTGKGEMLNMKDKSIDVIDAVCASSALPVLYNKTFKINGKEYCDGAIGNGIPIDFVLKKGCTDILLVLNNAAEKKNDSVSLGERMFSGIYMRKFPKVLRRELLLRNQKYNQALEKIGGLKNVNIGILSPERMPIKRMSRDRMKTKQLEKEAIAQVKEIFF